MILAGAGILIAAFFLVRRNIDAAFVAAALGAVAWFISYRTTMKELTAAVDADAANEDYEEDLENDEDNE